MENGGLAKLGDLSTLVLKLPVVRFDPQRPYQSSHLLRIASEFATKEGTRGAPKIAEISTRLCRPRESFIQGHERIRGALARSEILQNAHRGTRPGQCLDAALRRSWYDPL